MIHILVIEDDPTQRLLTSSVLKSSGYAVIEAEDGAAGLAKAAELLPDLIVCDVMMPQLNGYQLVEAFKREPLLAAIPVVMLTALSKRSQVRVGMTAGADDYLFKPFRASELRHSVAGLLAKRDAQRNQFARDAEREMVQALQLQKDELSLRYEVRLHQELNGRWSGQADVNTDICYERASLLLVNLFAVAIKHFNMQGSKGSAIRRVYQAAGDSLCLFGALHLLVVGDDLLAVFVGDETGGVAPSVSAARAAFGLQKMLGVTFRSLTAEAEASGLAASDEPDAPRATVALHQGAVQLIRINDPLHGGEGLTVVAGAAVETARQLKKIAQFKGWQIAASSSFAELASSVVLEGDRAATVASLKNPAQLAFELLPRGQV